MQAHQARRDDEPGDIDDLGVAGTVQAWPDGGDAPIQNQDIGHDVGPRRRIDDAATAQ